MSKFKEMTDQYLRDTYVPDVYQKTVFSIDFERLWQHGIRMLSFDVDDTIVPLEGFSLDKATVTFFEKLKTRGFSVYLVSNNLIEKRIELFAERLRLPYIAHAKKPSLAAFNEIRALHQLKTGAAIEPGQMAHIGNSLLSDVGSGKTFGALTCLVRNIGNLTRIIKIVRPEERELRHELEKRGIWVKHHQNVRHDQYYQLGELPAYKQSDTRRIHPCT